MDAKIESTSVFSIESSANACAEEDAGEVSCGDMADVSALRSVPVNGFEDGGAGDGGVEAGSEICGAASLSQSGTLFSGWTCTGAEGSGA